MNIAQNHARFLNDSGDHLFALWRGGTGNKVLVFIVIVFVTHFYNEVKVWYKMDDARSLVVDGLINKPKDLRI